MRIPSAPSKRALESSLSPPLSPVSSALPVSPLSLTALRRQTPSPLSETIYHPFSSQAHQQKEPEPKTAEKESSLSADVECVPVLSLQKSVSVSESLSVSGEGVPFLCTGRYKFEYVECEQLGRGGFGTVWKCRNVLDGGEYAVKRVRLRRHPKGQRQRQRQREERVCDCESECV